MLNKRQLLCCRGITEEEERGGFWVGVTICTTGGHNFRIRSWAVYAGRGVGTVYRRAYDLKGGMRSHHEGLC